MKKGLLWCVFFMSSLAMTSFAAAEDGAALVLKYRCNACHKVDAKAIGPSFQDIAKKYAGNATAGAKIGESIKNGSKGVWGSMPMMPNKNINDQDMKTIVDYVLGVK
ncbi:MAG: c-type cytochrome [Burkholderiales bacterium]|jgi:cytochrome c|nr:c-type cytochrome [Burkholderiales bacterium]